VTTTELLRIEGFVLLGLVGLVVGSFLNVVIYRVPLRRSVVRPRSSCPACGAAIAWYHNVPVVSWLVLGGKCAACHAPIAARYPFVEAANAALWLAAGWRYGITPETLVLLPFLSAMLALFFTDWDHKLLPDRITLPLLVLGLASAPWNARLDLARLAVGPGTAGPRLATALAGAAAGFGALFLVGWLWQVLFRREALGGGDLKLMAAVGAYLGLPGVVVTIFGGSLVGTLVALPFLLGGRWTMTRELPFGCFLTPAAALFALWGEPVVRWYLGLIRLG
jgi:leader peptidase (prepilin peptidase)/N-methyltransferase